MRPVAGVSPQVAEAREAIRLFDSVSGNFCFADVAAGDFGYQYSGRLPSRPPMPVPMPGWTGGESTSDPAAVFQAEADVCVCSEHEWDGDVPKDELPAEHNPPAGFLFTANNRTTSDDYPHYLT